MNAESTRARVLPGSPDGDLNAARDDAERALIAAAQEVMRLSGGAAWCEIEEGGVRIRVEAQA